MNSNCLSIVNATSCLESYKDPVCFYCNGYYGPTNAEYVCSTCHLFVHSAVHFRKQCGSYFSFEDSEESDSGNDEPSEGLLRSELRNLEVLFPFFLDTLSEISQHQQSQSNNEIALPKQYLNKRLTELSTHQISETLKPLDVDCAKFLPTEVMLCIFPYLDDASIWAVSNVCNRWRDIVLCNVPDVRWKKTVENFWPLYKPICHVYSWYNILNKLISDSPCKVCLLCNISLPKVIGKNTHWRLKRLHSEIKSNNSEIIEGIRVMPLERKMCHWNGYITGPVNSPYEGGIFYLYIYVPYSYPMSPPKIRFLTKIFHPNISRHGDIGLDSLSDNWSLALTVVKILLSIQSLLTDPFCRVAMEPEIAHLYTTNKEEYVRIAKEWTWKYAMMDILPVYEPSKPRKKPTYV